MQESSPLTTSKVIDGRAIASLVKHKLKTDIETRLGRPC